MTDSRNAILANIRQSLGRESALTPAVADALSARISAHPAGPIPAVESDIVARFLRKARAAAASADRVADKTTAVANILAFIEAAGLPAEVLTSDDEWLQTMPWSNRLTVTHGRAARGDDRISVTGAFAGVAETGTLMLESARTTPTTLNFLPEAHIVVLGRERIVANFEDAWSMLRDQSGAMPRTVNLITGPSKTADVEQTIQEGAHGPRMLHIIVVDQP